jgi:hypothetical protein
LSNPCAHGFLRQSARLATLVFAAMSSLLYAFSFVGDVCVQIGEGAAANRAVIGIWRGVGEVYWQTVGVAGDGNWTVQRAGAFFQGSEQPYVGGSSGRARTRIRTGPRVILPVPDPNAPTVSNLAGFNWGEWSSGPRAVVRYLGIPLWLPAILVVAFQVRWKVRQRRSQQLGECVACSYDLRGSVESDRCPECGRPIGDADRARIREAIAREEALKSR